jgi:drug/metabolite transporter (DMT)-like permease
VHPLALVLTLSSALTHAVWNTLTKRSGDPLPFIYLQFILGALLSLPFAIEPLAGGIPGAVLPLLAASTLAHAIYSYSLAQSYRLGDLSVVYPYSRGLGVALVPLAGWLVLREALTPVGIAGIALIVAGIAWIALRPGSLASVSWKQAAWMTLCGLGICAYAIIDKAAIAHISPLAYLPLILFGCCLWLTPAALQRREQLVTTARTHWRSLLIGAVFSTGGYILVLYAMRLAKVAYVVASRESSILFAVLLGGLVLREVDLRHRLLGGISIVCGVVCLALAR